MQFKAEKISDIWDEIFPLFEKHNNEVGISGEILKPLKTAYESLQERQKLHFIVARDINNKIIGYSMFTIANHHQYLDSIVASQEAFYLQPEYRGISSMRLFNFVENDLINLGVNLIIRHSCIERDWSRTLKRCGYKEKETMYVKRIGK